MIKIDKKTDKAFTIDGMPHEGSYVVSQEGDKVVITRSPWNDEYSYVYPYKKLIIDGKSPDTAAEAVSALANIVPQSTGTGGGGEVPANGITTGKLANSAVTTAKIADNAVTEAKLTAAVKAKLNQKASGGSAVAAAAEGADTVQISFEDMDLSKQAALLFVIGQSNSEQGDPIPAAQQKTATFFKNVKTLTYDNINNNVNNEAQWGWSPFTTEFNYNLGRKTAGQIYTMATSFALKWQERKNAGAKIPDLYIIQVSHSSFGFAVDPRSEEPTGFEYRPNLGGFNPLFDENPKPTYSDVPIERFWDFVPRVHKWALRNLLSYNRKVRHLGVMWNQFEHDVVEGSPEPYKDFLLGFIRNSFDNIIKAQVPFFYMYPNAPWFVTSASAEKTRRRTLIRWYFDEIEQERKNVFHWDVRTVSAYNAGANNFGVYKDAFHYKGNVYKEYVAQHYMNRVEVTNGVPEDKRNNGVIVSTIERPTPVALAAAEDDYAYKLLTNAYALSQDFTIPNWIKSGAGTFKAGIERKDNRRVLTFPDYKDTAGQGTSVVYAVPAIPTDTKYWEFELHFAKGSRFGLGVISQGVASASAFYGYGKTCIVYQISLDTGDSNFQGAPRLRLWNIGTGAGQAGNHVLTASPSYSSTTGFDKDTILLYKRFADGANDKFEVLFSEDVGKSFTSMATVTLSDAVKNTNSGIGDIGLIFGLGVSNTSGIGEAMKIFKVVGRSLE